MMYISIFSLDVVIHSLSSPLMVLLIRVGVSSLLFSVDCCFRAACPYWHYAHIYELSYGSHSDALELFVACPCCYVVVGPVDIAIECCDVVSSVSFIVEYFSKHFAACISDSFLSYALWTGFAVSGLPCETNQQMI